MCYYDHMKKHNYKELLHYKALAKEAGVNDSNGHRTIKALNDESFAKDVHHYIKAIYKLTGLTPNDYLPYK